MSLEPTSGDGAIDETRQSDRDIHVAAETNLESGESDQQPLAGSSRLAEPQFLHPSSILFEAISKVRQFIFPAVVGLFSAAQGGFWGAGVAVVIFGGSLVATVLRYFTLRYRIQGNDFVVKEGLLFRRTRSVPIRRIQNMDLIQNLLHRVFGVAEVNIETASGTKPEATLRVLTRSQIEELRAAIFGAGQSAPIASEDAVEVSRVGEIRGMPMSNSADVTDKAAGEEIGSGELGIPSAPVGAKVLGDRWQQDEAQEVHRIGMRELLLAGLASNRGFLLVGVVAGFFFQGNFFDNRYRPRFGKMMEYREYVPEVGGSTNSLLMLLGLFLGVVLLLRMLGMVWYVLRFFDYRLTRAGNDLRISCGLFTRVSATVPRKRIQFISVHRPLLMRLMGLASIRIETAGGSASEQENAASTVSRQWFLPVIRDADVNGVLNALRPGFDWGSPSEEIEWYGVSPRAGARLTRLVIIACLAMSLCGLAITRPWGWVIGIVAFPFLALIVRKKVKSRRYARTPWGLAYASGLFRKKLSFAFFDRIQTVELGESPFDRRWDMASLLVDTAAAGPADHKIDVSYLDAGFAKRQFCELQEQAAKHRPSWA
ncbi:MAG: PH domain-containing protein [Aureliella sp.]